MIYVKQHLTEKGHIIAMCDEELMGRVLHEGKVQIDLNRYEDFYKGELLPEEDAGKVYSSEEFYSANLVGMKSVNIFLKKGMISNDDVRKVKGIPFVQIYNVL